MRKQYKKKVWEREHNCHKCCFVAPKDYNSALEIKKLAIKEIRQEMPEEMEALTPH